MACSLSRCLRQMWEDTERLLEVPHGLAVGRPRHGLLPCLPAVRQSLVPHLPPQGMVRQPFDLLGQAVPGERLQGLDDAGMQARAAPGGGFVGHLLGEGMLEGLFELGEEAGFVQEFAACRWVSAPCRVASGISPRACSRRKGTSVPMTAAACRRRFSRVAADRCAPPAPPALWPAPGCSPAPAPGDRRRRTDQDAMSPPGSARSPPERRDCPWCGRSAAA